MAEREGEDLRVLPHHRHKLKESAVPDDVAAERGYWSAETKKEMEVAGFGPSQRRPPALVIPLHGVSGEVVGHQCRPDDPRSLRGRVAKYETQAGQRMCLDVPPRCRPMLADPKVPLVITEGPIKADALAGVGACAVALLGVWNWRGTNDDGGKAVLPDWEFVALNGRQVFVAFDSDVMLKPAVHDAMGRLAGMLERRGASVAYVYLPSGEHGAKCGVDDFLADGNVLADVLALARTELRKLEPEPVPTTSDPGVKYPPASLADVLESAHRFLDFDDDVPLLAVLAGWASVHLPGDPVWPGLLGGPGRGKTEQLMGLDGLPNTVIVSSLSGEAALLSGTSAQESAADATGGLLRRIGSRGVLVIKDFTSILSMHRDTRATILAALREVYDGHWSREVGTEGGRTLQWSGKATVLFGTTDAFDRAHGVRAEMGERFTVIRVPVEDDLELSLTALDGAGLEQDKRDAYRDAVRGLLTNLGPFPDKVVDRRWAFLSVLAARLRSVVYRDRSKGEVEMVAQPESPARLAKSMVTMHRALRWIGATDDQADEVIRRLAFDSVPTVRLAAFHAVVDASEDGITTKQVATDLDLPTSSVRRSLEDITGHGLLKRTKVKGENADVWRLSTFGRRLADGAGLTSTPPPDDVGTTSPVGDTPPPDDVGTTPDPDPVPTMSEGGDEWVL